VPQSEFVQQTIAHLSDLHFGSSQTMLERAAEMNRALLAAKVDHVVVTGDLTDGGRQRELDLFPQTFAELIGRGRMTFVPGNHDRLGDDVGASFMGGQRVDVVMVPGAYLVRVDSTGPHNRTSVIAAHGVICDRALSAISDALDRAPPGALVAILLHHHPVVLPAENLLERLATRFGLPYADELRLGEEMLGLALGRCDLVLHGHRHVPSAKVLDPSGTRPLRVYNAGCSPARGGANVFAHLGGALCGEPRWLRVDGPQSFVDSPPYSSTEYRLAS
jgi:3',5'-cyclic AMP phosphodiesterase CpdA